MNHLRYAGLYAERQRVVLTDMIAEDPVLMRLLQGMAELNLPDPLLGSGASYNMVWNVLTGRPRYGGIKDADIVYFDGEDLGYDAEDRVISAVQAHFRDVDLPVEVHNQARVHLWFPQKFGMAHPQLTCSADMLGYFATRTHAVAARLDGGAISIHAPFGLDDMFSFRLVPNPVLPNKATHDRKAARAKDIWPELTVIPWPE